MTDSGRQSSQAMVREILSSSGLIRMSHRFLS